jgi:hypothetical protein
LFLPGLPIDLIRKAFEAAPGNEIASGKFRHPESSAALAANTFGLFLNRPTDMPPLPNGDDWRWPASSVRLEATLPFPWADGRHPCLDVLIETEGALIGIESKRYEPYRDKPAGHFSRAYWRDVWGPGMAGYEHVRDAFHEHESAFTRLDAAQLVKHALGLRTSVHREVRLCGKRPVLLYLYAEPGRWPDGRPVSKSDIAIHRGEIHRFAHSVAGAEVTFKSLSYRDLLSAWRMSTVEAVREHAKALIARFAL